MQSDRDYYARRASRERMLADSADDSIVAAVHLRMARQYERRADGLMQESTTIVERH